MKQHGFAQRMCGVPFSRISINNAGLFCAPASIYIHKLEEHSSHVLF